MHGKILYALTVFISAFLLFQVQPMIAKMILPWFGGAAAVWITCMLFFQVALLAGYIYAHLLISHVRPRGQILIHLAMLCVSLCLLPVTPGQELRVMKDTDPLLHLLIILTTSVGLPYFQLSTTSPLLQSWYASAYRKALPYRLFALSNLASLLGLIAYPFFIEPRFTLSAQSAGWSSAYAVFAAACAIAALTGLRKAAQKQASAPAEAEKPDEKAAPPAASDKVMWLLLSACASVLLLATTNYLTQNIASIPFLWIVPLALYLFTFTLCFDRSGWYRRQWYVWIAAAFIAAMSYAIVEWGQNYSMLVTIPLFSLGMFMLCMFCHGELASRKPAPRYLTGFYLILSMGGAVGGAMIGIVVPRSLTGPFELPIALTATALLLLIVNHRQGAAVKLLCVALIAGTLWATASYIRSFTGSAEFLARDFYGGLKVAVYDRGRETEHRALIHGVVSHGIQFSDPRLRNGHYSYYAESSGIGMAFDNLGQGPREVGILGLGVGALASYARPGDTFRFYEIAPLVETVARQEFSYLADCRGKVDVIIGDGRLSIEQEPDSKFDLLVMDAFSSDSIPTHLVTLEALRLYFSKLKPDGILALHISNRHLNLAPVLKKASGALNARFVLIEAEGDSSRGISVTDWVLMSTGRDLRAVPQINRAAIHPRFRDDVRLWTDDYSNLLQILR
jgi:hypothetical protein